MSKAKARVSPVVLDHERVKHVLASTVRSRSDKDRLHQPRILLEADMFCTCQDSVYRSRVCDHLKALLETLGAKELRAWVLDSAVVRKDTTHEEDLE